MYNKTNIKYGFLLLIVANMIWGGNFVIGKAGVEFFPPITFSLIRWFIAFLCLSPIMIKYLKRDWMVLWKNKWVLLLLTITGISGYNTIIYFALQYTTSINAAVVNSTTPLIIAIFSIYLLKEKLFPIQAAGIGLSIIGIIFILSQGSLEKLNSLSFNIGDLFVLAAVVCWSLYSIIIKKYSKILPTISTLYVTAFLGVIILLPFSIFELTQQESSILFTPSSILILLYVGIMASIIAFLSWNIGVPIVGAAKSGIFLNLLPVFAAIFAILFTDEALSWYQAVGGIIILMGVLISSIGTQKVHNSMKNAVLSLTDKSEKPFR